MPDDENVVQLLTRHASRATEDVHAPASWLTTVPARATARRRRARFAAVAAGTLGAAGAAASIAVPLIRAGNDPATTSKPSTQLVAYQFVLADRTGPTATHQLPCLTGTPPAAPASSSVLSVGGSDGGTTCPLLQGRRDTALPAGARRVPGHGGRIYLAEPASGYRLGYRTYDDPAGGSPLILQIAVGETVPSTRLIDILDSVGLVPRVR